MPPEIPREEILNASAPVRRALLAASLLAWLAPALAAETRGGESDVRERGAYVLRAAGCVTCHTDSENGGAFLAGGRALQTPFGTFYSPNITFDRERGIGAWREEDFHRALRHGVAPDGSSFYPVFPYTTYTRMRREDIHALWVYLASVPTSAQENRPHDLVWYMRARLANRAWKLLFFDPGVYHRDPRRSQTWNRGAYLVTGLAHCGECHTPRTVLGNLDRDRAFAGTEQGPDGESVPNITPDEETGIGDWTRPDLTAYLSEGLMPDGDYAGGAMASVIDDGLSHLHADDIDAIAEYMESLKPIRSAKD